MTHDFPLTIKKSRRSKHLKKKIDAERRTAVLVVPENFDQRAAADFVNRNRMWITDKLSKIKENIYFTVGDTVSILGNAYRIIFHENEVRYSRCYNDVIEVYGKKGDAHKEVVKQARKIFENYAWKKTVDLAAQLGVKVNDITVKVIKSRYGSCSSLGNINFSLVLAFAPLFVVDMVIAHEVSHLKHMNHGQEFKKTLTELCPDCRVADKWLKKNAGDLRRIVLS